MPILRDDEVVEEAALSVGRMMLAAARTAPVRGGVNVLEGCLVYGASDMDRIVLELEEMAGVRRENHEKNWALLREANMVRKSSAVLLLGFRRAYDAFGEACGRCLGDQGEPGGRTKCTRFVETEKLKEHPIRGPVCSYRMNDFGYGVGSALWMAQMLLVDASPRYLLGLAALRMKLLPRSPLIVGIPISVTSKSPFRDLIEDPTIDFTHLKERLERIAPMINSLQGFHGE